MSSKKYIRKGRKYLPEEVLPFITTERKTEKEFDGDNIYMDSLRYHTFNKSLKCACCGIEGLYFVKERCNDSKTSQTRYHFNLYAVNDSGEEILMTKDHIVPKSKGGKNKLINMQTMCERCNKSKGSILLHHIKNKSTLVVGDILISRKENEFKEIFYIEDIDLDNGIVYLHRENEDSKKRIFATSYKYLHKQHTYFNPESQLEEKISE